MYADLSVYLSLQKQVAPMKETSSYHVNPDTKPFLSCFTSPIILHHLLYLRLVKDEAEQSDRATLDSLPEDILLLMTSFLVTN